MTLTAADRSSRPIWIAIVIAWIAAPTIVLIWLSTISAGALREELKVWQFWSLEACVFASTAFGVYAFKALRSAFDRRDAIRLTVLGAIALALTLFVAPRTNRIFYDEQIYQNVGQNLADLRRAQMCNDGTVESGRLRCANGEYNKQPYAYPHVLSVGYRLFGVHERVAFGVNALAMTLTAVSVYLLVVMLFGDRDAAFFAGLILALTPHQIMWSATAAVEPTASLALVVALVCAAHYLRSGGLAALGLMIGVTAYAIQFRPESLLIMPVIAALAWPRLQDDLRRPQGWWMALLFFVLVAVHVGHLFAVRNAEWGAPGPRFSIAYVPGNFAVNGWFYLLDHRFPAIFSLLALAGLWGRTFGWERTVMAVYFLTFFAVGLVFYAGSYNYGADIRYSLMTYPPIAILGGLGAARLVGILSRFGARDRAQAFVTAALALVFLWYAPVVRAQSDDAWAARADVRFARAVSAELPPNAFVLTHNPGMFQVWGVSAGQMSRAIGNPKYVDFLNEQHAGGVYVHWNFWCNVDDREQQALCPKVLAERPVDMVREYRERGQRYAFYRMKEPR
jgi:4-amino-4-deoxy-L-arabinose transferase-like glycosyltransferase